MACQFSDRLEELALGMLSEEEHEQVLRHLQECAECRVIAGDYLEALTALAQNIRQVDPPSSLRRAILAEARGSFAPPIPLRAERSARQRGLRAHWPAALAAAVAAVSLVWSVRLSSQLETQQGNLAALSRRYDTIVGVLAASDITVRNLSATEAAPGSMGRIYIDADTGDGMLMHRLPPLPDGQCYQLWFISHGERVDGGVLRTNPDGSGYTLIHAPGPVKQFDGVGVTREPAGGSRWPTSDRLLGAGI